MSTKPLDTTDKRLRAKAKQPVTHGEMAVMLSRWAQAADAAFAAKLTAAFAAKLTALKEELRAEILGELNVTRCMSDSEGAE